MLQSQLVITEKVKTSTCDTNKCRNVSDCPFVSDFKSVKSQLPEASTGNEYGVMLGYIRGKGLEKNCARVEELKI